MSQAGDLSQSSGPVPPVVATSYVTDVNSPAIPAANILNVLGNDTTANDDDGIRTDGSSGSNTLTVQLTNRIQGSVTTTDATTTTIITFPLSAAGTYALDVNVVAHNSTASLGAAYAMFVGFRSDGVTATKLNLEDKIVNEEAGMTDCNVISTASGNNALIQVIGIAANTINWNAVGTYVFRGP